MQLFKYITDLFKEKEPQILPYHIREGTLDDLENIRVLLSEFHNISPFSTIEVDQDKATEFIQKSIIDDNCKTFIATLNGTIVGIIIGTIQEFPFSREKNAQEIVWYVTPRYRGYVGKELYRVFAEWCYKQDVSVISMATPYDNYSLKEFYVSQGYVPVEDVYMFYVRREVSWLPLH